MAKLQVLLLTLVCLSQALAQGDFDEHSMDLPAQQKHLEKPVQELATSDFNIAFSAHLGGNGNFGPFGSNVILVYKNVFVNNGNAYDPGTGIFTAPIRGIYYFNFAGHSQSTRAMGLSLMKNGVRITVAYNHPAGNRWETVTQGAAVLLEKGDQVYILLQANTWVFDNDSNVTTFTGFLVSTLCT